VLTSVVVIICAYVASTFLVFPVRALARRFGILDIPGGRKSHHAPVPLLGGLAVFGALVIVVGGSLYFVSNLQESWLSRHFGGSLKDVSRYVLIQPKLWALLIGASVVTFVGIADDIKGVSFSPLLKFTGQIIAALVLLHAGIFMDLLNGNIYLSMLVSVLWIVGITNSFNLLDNMNGLSSGIALICSFVFLALVMVKGEFFIALLLSAIIGSTLGFFQFNIRGSIFLGDTGSLLLGYLLGAISIMARYVDSKEDSMFPVLAPLVILGLPLFDTFSVILIRLREKRSVFQGDQMHLSHRLVRIGMTKNQAVFFNYLMAFSIASTALFMINSRLLHSLLALALVLALVAMVSILMSTQARNGNDKVDAPQLAGPKRTGAAELVPAAQLRARPATPISNHV